MSLQAQEQEKGERPPEDVGMVNLKEEISSYYNLGKEVISAVDLMEFSNEEFLKSNVQLSDVIVM